jgi:hypothetical protein
VYLTLQEAAVAVSKQLKLDPALSPRDVDTYLRSWPADQLPMLVGGKRRFSPVQVKRLREDVEARLGIDITAERAGAATDAE